MNPTSYPPLGKLINTGSHQLHIYPAGEGDPTVVFESGGGGWSLDWYPVQGEVARFTRACSYDRAGFGWSDPGPKPRSSQQIVTELHKLLTRADIKPPYLMVGASFGGFSARLFAKNYPDEVAGIILLDARHEAVNDKMPPAWRKLETNGKRMYQFMLFASQKGMLDTLGKLLGEKAAPPMLVALPPELHTTYLEVGFQPKCIQAALNELAASAESDAQLSASGALGSLPLTVIRHGVPDLFSAMPADQASQSEQTWQELQLDLAKLSTNSQLLVAEKSGHRVQIDQPELVVDAIRAMVDAIRAGA